MQIPRLIAVATAILLYSGVAEACSVRGQFCGYPSWAANAFEDPFDRPIGSDTAPVYKPVKRPSVRKLDKKTKR